MDSITQDMKYRYSLMKYAEKYGVSRASRKYDKSRSYIYFWRKRFDGTIESLACRSRRPHSHPNQHTPEKMKLIQKMRRRNPKLGIVELWARLRSRGYSRCVESLRRVLRREGLLPEETPKKKYTPKPYEQMQYPGQRVQIDVKVVPRKCIADPELKLFQYTAIDEYSRYRVLGAYPEQSTYSSADFLRKVVKAFARKGIKVECVQDGQWLRIHKPVFSLKTRNQNSFRANRLRPGHTAQTDSSLHAPAQRQSRTQPPGRPKALLRFPSLLFSHRLWWAASCPPKSQQLSPHASSSMAFSSSDSFLFPCPICLTNLQEKRWAIFGPAERLTNR